MLHHVICIIKMQTKKVFLHIMIVFVILPLIYADFKEINIYFVLLVMRLMRHSSKISVHITLKNLGGNMLMLLSLR